MMTARQVFVSFQLVVALSLVAFEAQAQKIVPISGSTFIETASMERRPLTIGEYDVLTVGQIVRGEPTRLIALPLMKPPVEPATSRDFSGNLLGGYEGSTAFFDHPPGPGPRVIRLPRVFYQRGKSYGEGKPPFTVPVEGSVRQPLPFSGLCSVEIAIARVGDGPRFNGVSVLALSSVGDHAEPTDETASFAAAEFEGPGVPTGRAEELSDYLNPPAGGFASVEILVAPDTNYRLSVRARFEGHGTTWFDGEEEVSFYVPRSSCHIPMLVDASVPAPSVREQRIEGSLFLDADRSYAEGPQVKRYDWFAEGLGEGDVAIASQAQAAAVDNEPSNYTADAQTGRYTLVEATMSLQWPDERKGELRVRGSRDYWTPQATAKSRSGVYPNGHIILSSNESREYASFSAPMGYVRGVVDVAGCGFESGIDTSGTTFHMDGVAIHGIPFTDEEGKGWNESFGTSGATSSAEWLPRTREFELVGIPGQWRSAGVDWRFKSPAIYGGALDETLTYRTPGSRNFSLSSGAAKAELLSLERTLGSVNVRLEGRDAEGRVVLTRRPSVSVDAGVELLPGGAQASYSIVAKGADTVAEFHDVVLLAPPGTVSMQASLSEASGLSVRLPPLENVPVRSPTSSKCAATCARLEAAVGGESRWAYYDDDLLAPRIAIDPQGGVLIAGGPDRLVTGNDVTISGRVTDESPAKTVMVGGRLARLGAGGAFDAQLALTARATKVAVSATDACSQTGSLSFNIYKNNSPTLTVPSSISSLEQRQVAFQITGADADGDSLDYTGLLSAPDGTQTEISAYINKSSGQVTLPGTLFVGLGFYSAQFTVTERLPPELAALTPGSATKTVEIHVQKNQPPVFPEIGTLVASTEEGLRYQLVATDPEGEVVEFTMRGYPGTLTKNGLYTVPAGISPGEYKVEFEASDGFSSVWQEVLVRVVQNNRPPVITDPGNKTVVGGTALSFTLAASDPDGDPLTYSVTGGGTINATTGAYTLPASTPVGVYTVKFTVSDGKLSSSVTITITVTQPNRAPVITDPGNKTVVGGTALSFSLVATDPDGDPLTYSVTGGGSINATTGAYTLPASTPVGVYTVKFTVSDGKLSSSVTITITVTQPNRAPAITDPGNKTVVGGTALTFTLAASDPDGDPLTYSVTGGGSIHATTGAYTLPASTPVGVYTVKFTVSDGKLSSSVTITITVTQPNRAPVITDPGNKTVVEGQGLSFTVQASDADGDELEFSVTGVGTIDRESGEYVLPPETAPGTYSVTFTVSDGELQASVTTTIVVLFRNRPPVLTVPDSQVIGEEQGLSFTVTALDPDEDDLVFSIKGPGLINASTGVYTFPRNMAPGTYVVEFSVTDGEFTDTKSVSIRVVGADQNRPPVLKELSDRTVREGTTLSFFVRATDPEGASLTYTTSGPGTIDPVSGRYELPADTPKGVYEVTFTVSDGELSDSVTITITVVGEDDVLPGEQPNRAPVIAPVDDIETDGPDGFDLVVTDEDGDDVICTADVLPPGASFDADKRRVSWDAITPEGEYVVSIRCSDGKKTTSIDVGVRARVFDRVGGGLGGCASSSEAGVLALLALGAWVGRRRQRPVR